MLRAEEVSYVKQQPQEKNSLTPWELKRISDIDDINKKLKKSEVKFCLSEEQVEKMALDLEEAKKKFSRFFGKF